MALIFDIETDGFLEKATKIHCLVIKDTEGGETYSYIEDEVDTGVGHLQLGTGDFGRGPIIGHNIIKFDLPVIQKLYPWFTYDPSRVFDTLVASRLIWTNTSDTDGALIQQNKLPAKLSGRQSLEAWGYRMGLMKGEYSQVFKEKAGESYVEGSEWLEFSMDMLDYCVQDVKVTEGLYNKVLAMKYAQQALDLEHSVAFICAKMERTGFVFDVPKAVELYGVLAQKRDAILKTMAETFEPDVEEQRYHKKTGKPLKLVVTPFNPGSRKQIADRLTRKYGWKPTEFTPAGQPKIDEAVLGSLEYPEAKILTEYFTLDKRVGQLAEGDNAWLKLERDGVLHGGINPNGAVTGRATHQTPNLAQVPAVRSLYGGECRSLFTVRNGFSLVGCDLSGIEARLLAHFMHRYDGGAYATSVISGSSKDGTDIHTLNQKAAGLPTRDDAKTFLYAYLYGAGDAKIGSIIGKGAKEGKALKKQFLVKTPALKKLRDAVSKAAERGYLVGLDGRHIHVRSPHAALNSLLQSAGAVIAKQWLVEAVKLAEAKGWVWKEDMTGDYYLSAWIHDEGQEGVRDGLAESFGKLMVEAAKMAGEHFGLKVPVGAEYSIGKTWADTH